MKRILLISSTLICLLFCISACSSPAPSASPSASSSAASTSTSTSTSTATSTPTSTSTPNTKTTYGINETVTLNGVSVTLVSVTENKGSQYNIPNSGKVFVLCEFKIQNNTKNNLVISTIASFEAYVDDAPVDMSIAALIEKGEKEQLDGQVTPGGNMDGVIGYEVPTNWKELKIQLSPDVLSSTDNITFIATK